MVQIHYHPQRPSPELAKGFLSQYASRKPRTLYRYAQRQLALSPSLALVLRQYRAEQEARRTLLRKSLTDADFVFAHPDGTPLDPSTVSHTFNKVIRRAGLPHIRLHDLRYSHAALTLKAGVHPKVVSERLVHSSIRITLDTYLHVLPGLRQAAHQRFDDLLSPRAVGTENVSKMLANQFEIDIGVRGFEPPTT